MNSSTFEQFSFPFPKVDQDKENPVELISLPDAEMLFCKVAFSSAESDLAFQELLEKVEWQQDTIKYYGKTMPLPRLTAWYGDKGTDYKYSGIGMNPKRWTPFLLDIKRRVEEISQHGFNSVLLNLYRNGTDAVSWHQDNERELGENPIIASLSFGATRKFQFRHKLRKDLKKFEVLLTHGSLLIMKGTTQRCWQHQIPKTSKPIAERINLTFRHIF